MKKKFDCVKMKHDIQEQLYKETEGMTLKERFYYLKNKPLNNPKLEKFVNEVNEYHRMHDTNSYNVAESQKEYKTEQSLMQLVINTFGTSIHRRGELFQIKIGERKVELAARKTRIPSITTRIEAP